VLIWLFEKGLGANGLVFVSKQSSCFLLQSTPKSVGFSLQSGLKNKQIDFLQS